MCTYVKMKILFEICMTHFNNKVRGEKLRGVISYFPNGHLATHNLLSTAQNTDSAAVWALHAFNETVIGSVWCDKPIFNLDICQV